VAAVGAALLVAVGLAGAPAARSAPAAQRRPCGRPDQAPGFETPARAGVVPDVSCMDLQMAQDKAQAAGFYDLRSEDATGRGRHQIEDRNWVVVNQNPPAGTGAPAGTRLVFRVRAYGDPGAPPVPDRARPGPIPRLACFDLQEAQDTLQSAGFRSMRSRDATGRGRHPILDRDWTVVGQSPPPGGTYSKRTTVTLRVVKNGEPSACR
jgi:beta-lactam-binding protein with PASTA domain